MSTEYVLKEEFESFEPGKKFARVAVYGESHVSDAKLETSESEYTNKTVSVTKEQLEELFRSL